MIATTSRGAAVWWMFTRWKADMVTLQNKSCVIHIWALLWWGSHEEALYKCSAFTLFYLYFDCFARLEVFKNYGAESEWTYNYPITIYLPWRLCNEYDLCSTLTGGRTSLQHCTSCTGCQEVPHHLQDRDVNAPHSTFDIWPFDI